LKKENLTFLPISVNIAGKKIVIIGGGKVGYHKAVILNRFTDKATVISPQFHEGFDALPFERIQKEYEKEDLRDAFLVYVCTENELLKKKKKKEADQSGILTSVRDNPPLCDFISPAIVKQDNGTIAVSSNAQDVYQSIDIRNRIEQYWGEGDVPQRILRHLYRVASGLESSLTGERAIQGQLKQSYTKAVADYQLSPALHKLFQSAMHTGKRVRTETKIAEGAVSHSQITVDILKQKQIDLKAKAVGIIGVNKLTEDILKYLSSRGAINLFMSNRNFDKAQALATQYNGVAVNLNNKQKLLKVVDILICATSAPHLVINKEDIPNDKELLIFDLAFPRDVEECIGEMKNIELFNLEDIEHFAKQNIRLREEEIDKANQIIDEEIVKFYQWQNHIEKLEPVYE
jgi:glutamyl-tRNA reductase